MAFKIGQKIVCIDAKSYRGFNTHLIKDKIYTIHLLLQCSCGSKKLIVVENLHIGGVGSCACDERYYGVRHRLRRFEPLKYDIISNKEVIEEIVEEVIDVPVKEKEVVDE